MNNRTACESPTAACSETEVRGLIFDVKRFAIHDGPGIRTTVFLKGCPLACSWCHNPESQREAPEVFFWAERCVGCGGCARVCPTGAVSVAKGKAATKRAACSGCGACVAVCPTGALAIVGAERSVGEVLKEVERDLLFYDQSGGGLTLSGGEPLAQPQFSLSLLREAKRRRLSTAVDTCGHVPSEALEEACESSDLFLYDLKLIDSARHQAATGVSNELILENARRLDRSGARIWIRYPLVPGVNDRASDVEAIGCFVAELPSVEAIQVLPYHRAGEAKRLRLGRNGEDGRFAPPSTASLEQAVNVLERVTRRRVTMGG